MAFSALSAVYVPPDMAERSGLQSAPYRFQIALPPVNRGVREITRGTVEVVIIARAFRRQCRARAGYCRTRTIDRHRDGTSGKVRNTPTGYVGRYPEAIGSRRIEVAGVAARCDIGAAAAAARGTAR